MAIEVRPIQLPGDAVRFCKTWWPIYAEDSHWVPPLLFERKQFLNPKKNPYFAVADVQCFMAYRDGVAVGTISAQVDHGYQEVEAGVGFFGFFEFPKDVEVARALVDAAEAFLAERGMHEMRGPFNFNTNHEFGCLIDGFDTDPAMLNPHNRAYYGEIYEACGLTKSMDWFAYWMDNGPVPDQVSRIAKRLQERRPDIQIVQADMKKFDQAVSWFYEIYNDAWHDNWGHVHISEEEFTRVAADIKAVADERLIWFALIDGEPVAASLTFPDANQVAKKMNGKLFPFGWYHWVFGRKNIDQLRVFALGVKRKWQRLPIGALLYVKTWEAGMHMNIRGAEASLILETNHRMRGALEKLNARIYKTYRIYGKKIGEVGT
jgi:GNAT superfamily N-acetyltransferase